MGNKTMIAEMTAVRGEWNSKTYCANSTYI